MSFEFLLRQIQSHNTTSFCCAGQIEGGATEEEKNERERDEGGSKREIEYILSRRHAEFLWFGPLFVLHDGGRKTERGAESERGREKEREKKKKKKWARDGEEEAS